MTERQNAGVITVGRRDRHWRRPYYRGYAYRPFPYYYGHTPIIGLTIGRTRTTDIPITIAGLASALGSHSEAE